MYEERISSCSLALVVIVSISSVCISPPSKAMAGVIVSNARSITSSSIGLRAALV